MEWDKYKLGQLTSLNLHKLWLNAKARETNEAKNLVLLIEASGLDYLPNKQKSVSLDDPIGKEMHRVIFSPEGKRAILEAVASGAPALAGIDPLLQKSLGPNYNRHNESTVQAGYLVKNLMRQLGYEESGNGRLPSSCIAKTGKTFRPTPESKKEQ